MSCNVLITSEAEVKLYGRRLTETLPKLKRHHLILGKSCRQVTRQPIRLFDYKYLLQLGRVIL